MQLPRIPESGNYQALHKTLNEKNYIIEVLKDIKVNLKVLLFLFKILTFETQIQRKKSP